MDHVLRTQSHSDRLSDGNMHHTNADNIILGDRIGPVDTDIVRRSDQFRIRPPELSIGARIMEVPEELFAGDLNDSRILRLDCKIDRRPHELAHEYQEDEDHYR